MKIAFAPDLVALMQVKIAAGEKVMSVAMREAGTSLKSAWRGQITGAGLDTRLGNSIRLASFPKSGDSLNAAALVWSNAAVIIGAHDNGPLIRSKDAFWLAIPTPVAGKRMKGGQYLYFVVVRTDRTRGHICGDLDAILCSMGHALKEKRSDLIVQGDLVLANGYLERGAALSMPREAQKSRYSANHVGIQHKGYALSIKHRKRFEEAFFSAEMGCRRVEKARSRFILTMSANNFTLSPRLLAI